MFRFHKRFVTPKYGCVAPYVVEEKVELDGSVTQKLVKSNQGLPSAKNFDLALNIKTKTNLDQVSTKICRGNLEEVCAEALSQPEPSNNDKGE